MSCETDDENSEAAVLPKLEVQPARKTVIKLQKTQFSELHVDVTIEGDQPFSADEPVLKFPPSFSPNDMNVRNCSKSDAQQGIHRDCSALDEVSNVHHTTSPGVSRQPIVEDDAFGTAMLLGNLHRSWNGCPWDTSIGSTSKGLFEEVSDAFVEADPETKTVQVGLSSRSGKRRLTSQDAKDDDQPDKKKKKVQFSEPLDEIKIFYARASPLSFWEKIRPEESKQNELTLKNIKQLRPILKNKPLKEKTKLNKERNNELSNAEANAFLIGQSPDQSVNTMMKQSGATQNETFMKVMFNGEALQEVSPSGGVSVDKFESVINIGAVVDKFNSGFNIFQPSCCNNLFESAECLHDESDFQRPPDPNCFRSSIPSLRSRGFEPGTLVDLEHSKQVQEIVLSECDYDNFELS